MVQVARNRAGSPSRRRGEPVVRRVLSVALRLLAEVGYQRLSIPEVAARAGLNKTSVYRRWPTKRALIREALAASTPPPPQVPDTGALRSDLLALAVQTSAFVRSQRGRALLRVLVAEGPRPGVRALIAGSVQQPGHDALHQVFRRAIQRGELRPGVDVDLVLFTLAGALMHRTFVEQRPIDDAYVGRVVDLLLRGAGEGS